MKRIWMPLYVADYLRDTGPLTTLEHGAYLLLIMHYWSVGSIPPDAESRAAIAKMAPRDWHKIEPKIARMFQDGWKHKRIDAEIAKTESISDKRKNAAATRWQKDTNVTPFRSDR